MAVILPAAEALPCG